MSFLLRKVEDVTTISKPQSKARKNQQTTVTHFGENKRPHLESSKQNYYIFLSEQ